MLLIFAEIIFSLFEIVKTVIGSRCGRFPGGSLLALAAFLVLIIQRTDVVQSFDFFLLPALEDFVRILETCLSGLENGTVTCLLDDLHGKTIRLEPGIHKRDLCLNRVTVRDPQRLENRKIFLIIT